MSAVAVPAEGHEIGWEVYSGIAGKLAFDVGSKGETSTEFSIGHIGSGAAWAAEGSPMIKPVANESTKPYAHDLDVDFRIRTCMEPIPNPIKDPLSRVERITFAPLFETVKNI